MGHVVLLGAVFDNDACVGRVPPGATRMVVSAGGNDALQRRDVLGARAGSVADPLLALAEARGGLARGHRAMLEAVLARGLPAALRGG
jgi:hypothetical protein